MAPSLSNPPIAALQGPHILATFSYHMPISLRVPRTRHLLTIFPELPLLLQQKADLAVAARYSTLSRIDPLKI